MKPYRLGEPVQNREPLTSFLSSRRWCGLMAGGLLALSAGCTTVQHSTTPPAARAQLPPPAVQTPTVVPSPAPTPSDVNGLVQTALAANPKLAKANSLIEAARGRYVQAGLKPNPVFSFNADELGDRTGPMGLLSPSLSQEFVLGGKLTLAQAVAAKEVDQATLDALAQRYAVVGQVRAAAYELAALRQRREVLGEVVGLAGKSVEQATRAEKNPNATLTRGDVLPLELDLERFKAEHDAVEKELPAAERRLAALVGDARLPVGPFATNLSAPLPEYELDVVRDAVMEYHPDARAAAVAVDRAQAAVRRAEAELIPNVTGSVGYVRQNQNLSNDWSVGVSVPLVTRNKNQGNIRAARADVMAATLDVTRVQNDLAERVATAFRKYAAAKVRAERYRDVILKKAEENYQFVKSQLDRGVVEYLKVLQAQRAVAEAKLEYNQALGEAWTAAAELSALVMEESFPPALSSR